MERKAERGKQPFVTASSPMATVTMVGAAAGAGDLPASVQKEVLILQALQHKLCEVETLAQPLSDAGSVDNVEKELSSLEAAKLEVAMAYSLANLYFVQLNIAGKDVSGHPLHEILNRIKEFMALIIAKESAAQQQSEVPAGDKRKAVDEKEHGRGGEETVGQETQAEDDGVKQKKRKIKVNKAGVERVVRHHIA